MLCLSFVFVSNCTLKKLLIDLHESSWEIFEQAMESWLHVYWKSHLQPLDPVLGIFDGLFYIARWTFNTIKFGSYL